MVIAKVKAASTTSKPAVTHPLKETQNFQATTSPQSKHSSKGGTSSPSESLFSPNKNREFIEANCSRANDVILHLGNTEKYLPEINRTSSIKSIPSTGATREAAAQIEGNHTKNYSENKQYQISSTKPTASDAARSMKYATKSLYELTRKLTKPCSVKMVRLTDAQISGRGVLTSKDMRSKSSTDSTSSRENTPGTGFISSVMSFVSNAKSSKSIQTSPGKSRADSRMATSTPIISDNASRKTKLQHTSDWFESGQTKIQTPPYEHASSAARNPIQPGVTKSKPRKTPCNTSLPAEPTPATTATKLRMLPLPALPWLKVLEAAKQTSSMKSTPPSVSTKSSTPTSINSAKSTPQSVGRHSINPSSVSPATKKTTPNLLKSQLRPIPSPQWLRHVLLTPKPPQTPAQLSDLSVSDDE